MGRETACGPVPKTLRPIFRDRDDFAGGHSLKDATLEALRSSEALVVVCSPHAAASPYVNEEIRQYKALGRADRVIPIILDGEPHDPARDCFPEALKREVDAEGRLTEQPVEPIAADARDQGDGRQRAAGKVVAGLLGLPFNEIALRAERDQRRRVRRLALVAAVMFLLALATGVLAIVAERERAEAQRNFETAKSAADSLLEDIGVELARMGSVEIDTVRRIFDRTQSILDKLVAEAPDALDLRERQALLSASFAMTFAGKGEPEEALATLDRAIDIVDDLLAAHPGTRDFRKHRAAVLVMRGMILRRGERLVEAQEAFRVALAELEGLRQGGDLDTPLFTHELTARVELGRIAVLREEPSDALLSHAVRIAADRLEREPDVLAVMVGHAGARAMRAEGRLHDGDPHAARVDAREAERGFRAALAEEPDNEDYRSSLGIVLGVLAQTHAALGDRVAQERALRTRAGVLSRRVRYAETDAEALRLAADDALGEAEYYLRSDRFEEAEGPLHESLGLFDRAREQAPDDALYRVQLHHALTKQADILRSRGDQEGVILAESESLDVLAPIPDPSGQMLMLVGMAHARRGMAEGRAGDFGAALRDMVEAQRTVLRAHDRMPDAPLSSARFQHLHQGVLAAVRKLDREADVVEALRASHGVWTRLQSRMPEARLPLAELESFLASLGDDPSRRWREVVRLLDDIESDRPLSDAEVAFREQARAALRGG